MYQEKNHTTKQTKTHKTNKNNVYPQFDISRYIHSNIKVSFSLSDTWG